MEDSKPRYNLKVIVQETGIRPDTLRAWERRYGLPAPERTEGGHRLYSQRDLAIIQWLLARREEGLSISRAAQLWRDLSANGRDPLQEAAESALVHDMTPATAVSDLASLRDAWLRACLNLDEQAAERVLGQALARHAPELVCLELLQKGLTEMGRLWYESEATVQQEHFASALAMRQAHALLKAAPPPTRSQLIYLACPPGEEHSFPLLLLTLLLRYRGWPVAYFGSNVPLAQLDHALEVARPALAVLAAQTLPAAAEALEMGRFLHERQIRLAYGGRIFNRLPALRQIMPGDFLGESLAQAADRLAEILIAEPPPGAVAPLAPAYRRALDCFERQQPLVAWEVRRALSSEQWPEKYLETANMYLARDIRAALALGDLALLDQEMDWLRGLLAHAGPLPEEILARFLDAYHQAAQEHLDEDCRPVLEWLARVEELRREA